MLCLHNKDQHILFLPKHSTSAWNNFFHLLNLKGNTQTSPALQPRRPVTQVTPMPTAPLLSLHGGLHMPPPSPTCKAPPACLSIQPALAADWEEHDARSCSKESSCQLTCSAAPWPSAKTLTTRQRGGVAQVKLQLYTDAVLSALAAAAGKVFIKCAARPHALNHHLSMGAFNTIRSAASLPSSSSLHPTVHKKTWNQKHHLAVVVTSCTCLPKHTCKMDTSQLKSGGFYQFLRSFGTSSLVTEKARGGPLHYTMGRGLSVKCFWTEALEKRTLTAAQRVPMEAVLCR